MLFKNKKKLWQVSFIAINELGYEGGGRYCQHNLTEEGAAELFKMLINNPLYACVTMGYDAES